MVSNTTLLSLPTMGRATGRAAANGKEETFESFLPTERYPPMSLTFTARATNDARAHAHPVPDAGSAMEAAILFAERWLPDAVDGEVQVTVTDCGTGHEQCFRIDLGEGEAGPC